MGCLSFLKTPTQQLFEAAATNDIQLAKHALHHHNVANTINKDRDTPIHVAVRHGHLDILQFLLRQAIDLQICNKRGYSPLHEAASKGNLMAVKMILQARRIGTVGAADANQMQGLRLEHKKRPFMKRALLTLVDFSPAWRSGPENLPLKTRGWTALHIAVSHNDTEIAEELLKYGANVDEPNEFARTPLHLAAYGNRVDAVLLLLLYGANPNAQDSQGDTPLHDAVAHDHFEVTEILLFFGASNAVSNNDGKIPSLLAPNMVIANVTTRPLHVAVASGQLTLVEGMLEHGAVVNETGAMGETPLHLAAAHNDVEIARLLIEHDADVNAVDTDYNTPLHYAAGYGHNEMVEFLLGNGGQRDMVNMDGKTPKQLVPVLRNRRGAELEAEGKAEGPSRRSMVPQHIEVQDDIHLKIARRMSTNPGVISTREWHESQSRIPGRESTRYSIAGFAPTPARGGSQMNADASSKVAPAGDKSTRLLSRKSMRVRSGRLSRAASSKMFAKAAEDAAREQALLEEEQAKIERLAVLAVAVHRHMMRLRPWGRVIPPSDLQEVALAAALDEVDGEGAGAAARQAEIEEFRRIRKEKMGKGTGGKAPSGEGGGGGAAGQAPGGVASRRIAPMELGH